MEQLILLSDAVAIDLIKIGRYSIWMFVVEFDGGLHNVYECEQ